MFEVYWANYEDRNEEPEEVFDTWREANDYIDLHADNCGMDEWYVIHDVENNMWY